MQFDDGILFFSAEISSFNVRPQVIYPPEPAALSTPQQTWKVGKKEMIQNQHKLPACCQKSQMISTLTQLSTQMLRIHFRIKF